MTFGREPERYPDEQCLLIKFAVGGTDLFAQWTTRRAPTGIPGRRPLWVELKQHIDDARAPDAMGYEHQIDRFIWMQGERRRRRFRANAYDSKLTDFIASMRSHTGRPDLPFILGRIRDAALREDRPRRTGRRRRRRPEHLLVRYRRLPFLPDGIHYDEPSMLVRRAFLRQALRLRRPGDVNRDGKADVDDLYEWTQNPTDLNCDGVADRADMDIVVDAVRTWE